MDQIKKFLTKIEHRALTHGDFEIESFEGEGGCISLYDDMIQLYDDDDRQVWNAYFKFIDKSFEEVLEFMKGLTKKKITILHNGNKQVGNFKEGRVLCIFSHDHIDVLQGYSKRLRFEVNSHNGYGIIRSWTKSQIQNTKWVASTNAWVTSTHASPVTAGMAQ